MTEYSPAAQSIVVLNGAETYDPNRQLTPTIVLPEVRAIDPDNIFKHGSANEYLSLDTMQWYIDGEPIEDSDWVAGTDYSIDTSETDYRGALRINKNLPASTQVVLSFKGSFLDWRTGIPYTVESDTLMLVTTDKGDDVLACSVDKPCIVYDPLYDDLLLYEYKVARGIAVTGTRADHIDGKSYEQTVTVLLTRGNEAFNASGAAEHALPSDITMRVVRLGSSTALVPNSETAPELMAATYPTVKFDMRMIASGEYEVQFLKNGAIVARATIGMSTGTTMPSTGKGARAADLSASESVYQNRAMVSLSDRLVDYPELYYLLQWYTQAHVASVNNGVTTWVYAAAKSWQRGEHMICGIEELGIGMTVNDSFFDCWFNVDAHASRELCLDDENVVLTDENGEFLID